MSNTHQALLINRDRHRRPNPRLRLPEVLQSPRRTLDRRTRTRRHGNGHHREGNSLNRLGRPPRGESPRTGTPRRTKTGKTKNEAKPKRTGCERPDLFPVCGLARISPRAKGLELGYSTGPLFGCLSRIDLTLNERLL